MWNLTISGEGAEPEAIIEAARAAFDELKKVGATAGSLSGAEGDALLNVRYPRKARGLAAVMRPDRGVTRRRP